MKIGEIRAMSDMGSRDLMMRNLVICGQKNKYAPFIYKAIKASSDRDVHRAMPLDVGCAKFDAMRERMLGGLERTHAYEAFILEAANDEEWRRAA